MVQTINYPNFALSIGIEEKSINDLSNFTNYAINPTDFNLYVGKDRHIYAESLTETSLSDEVAQLFKRALEGAHFDTRENENKQIFLLAHKAFITVLSKASQDPDAAEYLDQLEMRLASIPESQAKTSLLSWIQEIRQQWKLNPQKPTLVYRKLQEAPKAAPKHSDIAQVAKDGFAKLKNEHTANQALAIAVNPFLTFPGNLEKMIRKNQDLHAAAREVANFYQAIQQLDQFAPAISPENRTLIENCLKIYALGAEQVVLKYREGENVLKAVFSGRKRPSEELSPQQSVPLRR